VRHFSRATGIGRLVGDSSRAFFVPRAELTPGSIFVSAGTFPIVALHQSLNTLPINKPAIIQIEDFIHAS
jgi:hypothetical protein